VRQSSRAFQAASEEVCSPELQLAELLDNLMAFEPFNLTGLLLMS
jgi:hypothetical protein